MLFTSNIFLYGFLPCVLGIFFLLAKVNPLRFLLAPLLIIASFAFYGYKDPFNIIILLISIITNYATAVFIVRTPSLKTVGLWLGVIFNLCLLFYYKYTNFFFKNLNLMNGQDFNTLDIVLPLAISFYTFQQIAYLADAKKGQIEDVSFKNYLLFVTFFPQLIIGPIVHHKEMMPQFFNKGFGLFSWRDFKIGYLYLFSGLVKKVFLSDYCAQIVNSVHTDILLGASVNFADAWSSALAFSFQIYFDFSGYTDMAIGIAYMFSIKLPFNFNSPYKSRNIGEFWRRWHMTLSRWLRDYLYVPLGGNTNGVPRALVNAMIVFFLGGLWHGAAWTFILWGLLQGIGITIFRASENLKITLPAFIAIFLTFLFATLSWVLFRSASIEGAETLYIIMVGTQGFDLTLRDIVIDNAPILLIATILTFAIPNTHSVIPKFSVWLEKIPLSVLIPSMIMFWLSLMTFDLDSSAEFIYFDF